MHYFGWWVHVRHGMGIAMVVNVRIKRESRWVDAHAELMYGRKSWNPQCMCLCCGEACVNVYYSLRSRRSS